MRTETKSDVSPAATLAFGNMDLIPVEAFAGWITWHPESVRRACRQGRIRAVKLGRGWRIPRTEAVRIAESGIPMELAV